jgi:hypothetical protein
VVILKAIKNMTLSCKLLEEKMSHSGKLIFRFIGFLVLLALLAGAGVMLFQAGQAQGFAMGAASTGQQLQSPMPYYGYGMMHAHFFPFMGFFGIIPLLFGLFIIGGLFRLVFFGSMHMHHGPWERGGYPHHPWGWGPQSGESEKTPPTPPTTEPK